jgi:hypothetical protein
MANRCGAFAFVALWRAVRLPPGGLAGRIKGLACQIDSLRAQIGNRRARLAISGRNWQSQPEIGNRRRQNRMFTPPIANRGVKLPI